MGDPSGGYGFGRRSAVQNPIKSQAEGEGEVSKRLVAEMERQHEIFLRSVKQKTHVASPMSPLSPNDLSSPSPSSLKDSSMRNQLLELERRLLCDDDEEDEASASDSVVTNNEWGETISSSSSSTKTSRQLLLDTAAAIGDGILEAAQANLTLLKRAADPRGDPEQRLTAIMVAALNYCLDQPPTRKLIAADLYSADHRAATCLLHEISPCFKLALLAANFSILEAARDHTKLHVIDFDLGGGAQLAALIHALADRHVPSLKITAVADPTSSFIINSFNSVGERLKILADRVGVSLRFSMVSRKEVKLDRASLGCEPDEALAVNLPFVLSRVADESVSPANPRDELLRRVRSLSPHVVALVEQDMNVNTSPFSLRFAEACGHYGSIMDSLAAIAGRVSSERIRIETALAWKAVNVVACEGADRVERCEVFGKWRARMGMAGLRPVPLGSAVVDPVRVRLDSIRPNPGFMAKEENGGLGFGYMGRILTYVSAWR
ncbi:scarecrow-like protein 8 [Typha latifolia]|uniref:scarecrow-like protein 8 n=1 Tax=Typha latifolia TaxID=4733 RepID=UPI003C2CA2B6